MNLKIEKVKFKFLFKKSTFLSRSEKFLHVELYFSAYVKVVFPGYILHYNKIFDIQTKNKATIKYISKISVLTL